LLVAAFLFLAFLTADTFYNLLPEHFLYGFAFIFFALSLHFWPNVLLVNKITTLIGKLSFSIYLVHFIVIDMLPPILFKNGIILNGNIGFILAYFLVLLISMGISFITYYLIEIPGINLGKKIIRKLS